MDMTRLGIGQASSFTNCPGQPLVFPFRHSLPDGRTVPGGEVQLPDALDDRRGAATDRFVSSRRGAGGRPGDQGLAWVSGCWDTTTTDCTRRRPVGEFRANDARTVTAGQENLNPLP
jgi:hypothetical protein